WDSEDFEEHHYESFRAHYRRGVRFLLLLSTGPYLSFSPIRIPFGGPSPSDGPQAFPPTPPSLPGLSLRPRRLLPFTPVPSTGRRRPHRFRRELPTDVRRRCNASSPAVAQLSCE